MLDCGLSCYGIVFRFYKNKYNRIFMFDYALYQEFYKKNPEGIFYLPLGANYQRVDQVIKAITETDKKSIVLMFHLLVLYIQKNVHIIECKTIHPT